MLNQRRGGVACKEAGVDADDEVRDGVVAGDSRGAVKFDTMTLSIVK